MSAGKKRQTMAKQARERAVRERRALKLERKREAAHLRLAGGEETPAEDTSEPGLRLVSENGHGPEPEAADAAPEPTAPDESHG